LKRASVDIPKTNIDIQYGQFNSYTNDNSFTISQSFAFPTVYINQNRMARAQVKSSEWQLKSSQLEVATQVKQVYWQLAYLYSKQALLRYQDSLYSGFFRAAALRAKLGETNQLEMISARSQSLEIKNTLHEVAADMVIYIQKLQMHLNTQASLAIVDTLLKRIDFVSTAQTNAIDANPAVGYVVQQIEIAQYEKQLERSRLLPDFSVGYFSQTMQGVQDIDGVSQTFGSGDRFTGIQAGIAIPLWFTPYTARIKSAKLKEEVAQTNAAYYKQSVVGNYNALMAEYTKYSNSVDFYEQQAIPEANSIIAQATRSYQVGAMDYLEYILSLNRALSIKQNYLDALNSYNQTIINIEFITGKIF